AGDGLSRPDSRRQAEIRFPSGRLVARRGERGTRLAQEELISRSKAGRAWMQFGVICEFRNPDPWLRNGADVYQDILDLLHEVDRLGFGAVEVVEHHFVEDGYIPSPVIALSAIAA